GAALVAADSHLHFAGGDDGAAARRGASRGVAHLARVVHRACGTGVAAAREAEVLAVDLAHDGAAGVEHTRDDRGVDVGDVALEARGAVHHRHAGQADVVLERDALALELAARRALHLALVVPGVVLVLRALGTITGRAGILHDRHRIGHGLDGVIRGDTAA